jgi:hemoglobin
MKTVHAGLGITESDWQLTVKHLTATLDRFKVAEKERSEVPTLFSSLKSDIVEKINAIEAWCKNAIRTG